MPSTSATSRSSRPTAAYARSRCRSSSGTGRSPASCSCPAARSSTLPDRAGPDRQGRQHHRRPPCDRGPAARRHVRIDRPATGCADRRQEPDGDAVGAGPRRPPAPAALRDRALLRRVAGQVRGDLSCVASASPGQPGLRVGLDAPRRRRVWSGAATITFQFAEHARKTVHVRPGQAAACYASHSAQPRTHRVTYRSKKLTLIGVRAVTVRATAPVFTPSLAACASTGRRWRHPAGSGRSATGPRPRRKRHRHNCGTSSPASLRVGCLARATESASPSAC